MSAIERPLLLASYKLRFHEGRVRAVPARDELGCPFSGPGVDLHGEEALPILGLAAPFEEWLHALETGVVLRSLSVDLVTQRVLVTLAPERSARPRVVRIDPPESDALIASSAALTTAIGHAAREKLRRRRGA